MRKSVLKLFLKLQSKDIFKAYDVLKSCEHKSIEKNQEIQRQKLEKVLMHSYKYVPYYRKIFRRIDLVRHGDVDLNKFNRIPVLTKDLIRKRFDELKSEDPGFKKRHPYVNTSGGSTGEPVKFIQDNVTWTENMASKWLFYSFVLCFPCKHLKLWGSERDILQGGYEIKSKIKNWIYRRKLLNSFKMTQEDMYHFVEEINRFKPEIIEAYVQSIFEFVKYVDKKKLSIYSPKGIITSAGILTLQVKNYLKKVIQCEIYNRYGSREVGDMACSCSRDEGLHVNILNYFIEILDDEGMECKPGEIGNIYVTSLVNYSMPLIRYSIGDMAVFSKRACSCGRGFPLLDKVVGRTVNMFKKKDGALVDGEYFTHLFYLKDWVEKFQIIQYDYDEIEIRIVLNGKRNLDEERDIIEKSKIVMGKDCNFRFKFVDDILPTKSGKYLYTISNVE